jgi:hypothetical protein
VACSIRWRGAAAGSIRGGSDEAGLDPVEGHGGGLKPMEGHGGGLDPVEVRGGGLDPWRILQ